MLGDRARLRPRDLQAPAGPDRAAAPAAVSSDRGVYGTTPTARRDAGHEPGRFPAKGHINKPLWARPPAGVHDTLTTTAVSDDAVYVTRVRQVRKRTPTAAVLRIDL